MYFSRRAVRDHRRRHREVYRSLSDQSRRGLDWSYFFMADVQAGFGSFVAFYLASLGWSRQNVGWALSIGGLVAVGSQVPGGALADFIRAKRGLAAAGFLMLGSAALIFALHPTLTSVFFAEILQGLTACTIGPALSAITLGLVARRAASVRIGRNLRYEAAGTVVMAVIMGALGACLPKNSIFFAMAVLSLVGIFSLSRIRTDEIDYARARNAIKRDGRSEIQGISSLFRNRNLLLFGIVMALFQLANASMLPLVSESLGSKVTNGTITMSGLIVGPQILVTVFAPWTSYFSELWGRKPFLLVGIGTVALRAALFSVVHSPLLIILVQLLDGVTGAIVTSLVFLTIVDLTTGSGRFNLAQGFVGTLNGIAASISTVMIGFIVQRYGDRIGFLAMALIAILATVTVWLFLPETKPVKYVD